MAERYAVASGNWSNTATWDGGTLPGVSDDVHAGSYAVTIDQDVTVLTLRTDSGSTAPAGGSFTAISGIKITASEAIGGNSTCLKLTNAGSRFFGNAKGSITTPYQFGIELTDGSIMVGNATGGSQFNSHGAQVTEGGILIGNATGGSSSGVGANVSNGGMIVGKGSGGSFSNAHGINLNAGGVAKVSLASGDTANAFGVNAAGYSTLYINSESGSYPSSIDNDADATFGTLPYLEFEVVPADILTSQLTESYAADGVAPTLSQAIFLIQQAVTEFAIVTDTIIIKKLDGTTTAATCTMDSASAPTSRTRAT